MNSNYLEFPHSVIPIFRVRRGSLPQLRKCQLAASPQPKHFPSDHRGVSLANTTKGLLAEIPHILSAKYSFFIHHNLDGSVKVLGSFKCSRGLRQERHGPREETVFLTSGHSPLSTSGACRGPAGPHCTLLGSLEHQHPVKSSRFTLETLVHTGDPSSSHFSP